MNSDGSGPQLRDPDAVGLVRPAVLDATVVPAGITDTLAALRRGRWWQLILGIICMSMIANLQYGWTLFVNPIHDNARLELSAIQVAFTMFVFVETWLVPFEGYLVDKIGPQFVGVAAGHPGRARVGDQFDGRLAAHALSRRGRRRHRRGRGVRRVRRQRAQVVSRSARPCGRPHRDGLRRGIGADGVPDREHDQVAGLRGDVLQVRHRAGRASSSSSAGSSARPDAQFAAARDNARTSRGPRARVHADRDAARRRRSG